MKVIDKKLKGLTLKITNNFYKDAVVEYVHTYNGIAVYTGEIQSKRGKKNHTAFLFHSKDSLYMRVIEGLKEITFMPQNFSYEINR